MTCIAAYAKGGKVWMGGDSAGVDGFSLVQRSDEKVFAKDGFLFGFTSSFRMGQLLRYRFQPPRRHPDTGLVEFMSTDFVDGVRGCLKEYGFAEIHNSVEKGGFFLVGVEGRIFQIEEDFQVGESIHPFDAVGCGSHLALGAFHVAHRREERADTAVLMALQAAETFSAGVRGPFTVISSGAA